MVHQHYVLVFVVGLPVLVVVDYIHHLKKVHVAADCLAVLDHLAVPQNWALVDCVLLVVGCPVVHFHVVADHAVKAVDLVDVV